MRPIDDNPEARLASINRRLAELLRMEELELTTGGAEALGDRLWVWGIVGGKEVGKSTLINALAGGAEEALAAPPPVAHGGSEPVASGGGERVAEGTFRPGAYLHADDDESLRSRFSHLGEMVIDYHAKAPDAMRGLVLVDLPDFDSLFDGHVEQVRRIAGVLDGIIWVTTPKKVGDLRGMKEIRRVLKSRTNFVYVVNKMDWLLAQSDGPPLRELERMSAALQAQVRECDARWGGEGEAPAGQPPGTPGDDDGADRPSFLISAKYRTRSSLYAELAGSVGEALAGKPPVAPGSPGSEAQQTPGPVAPDPGPEGEPADSNPWAPAMEWVLSDFETLRHLLTTAPTTEAATANKRANLAYQSVRQGRQLLEYYRLNAVLERLERHAGPEAVEETVARAFPVSYCDRVLGALNDERRLAGEWSSSLFRKRIADWPALGVIAWPMALLAGAVGSVRSVLSGRSGSGLDDVFGVDGLSVEDRAGEAVDGVRARLARVSTDIRFELPEAKPLARQIRGQMRAVADARRAAVIEPYLTRGPAWMGRLVRTAIPLAVLLWFPLVQPLLSAGLSRLRGRMGYNVDTAAMLVQTLSASNILMGLLVSLLILAGLVAAVYSGSVRDSFAAVRRLRASSVESIADPLVQSIARAIDGPIDGVRLELGDAAHELSAISR